MEITHGHRKNSCNAVAEPEWGGSGKKQKTRMGESLGSFLKMFKYK